MSESRVEQWLAEPYALRVRLLSADEGGGWLATIPQLGESGYNGVGDTEAEAISDLRELQRHLFERLAAAGDTPPPAQADYPFPEELPSGNIALRLSRQLHADLKRLAAINGISLNSQLQELICVGLGRYQALAAAAAEPVTAYGQDETAERDDDAPVALGRPTCIDADDLRRYAA